VTVGAGGGAPLAAPARHVGFPASTTQTSPPRHAGVQTGSGAGGAALPIDTAVAGPPWAHDSSTVAHSRETHVPLASSHTVPYAHGV
jgi:hypothetical protein